MQQYHSNMDKKHFVDCCFFKKKTRRMDIANGTCVSFCNQPKGQFGYTSGESRWYVVAFTRFVGGGIWLPQESLRHILASPG